MVLDPSLRTQYFDNGFVDRLRMSGEVNEEEWHHLCQVIRKIGDAWRGSNLIDKDIVQDLFVLPTIIRGSAEAAQMIASSAPKAARLLSMAEELEALILEVLGD